MERFSEASLERHLESDTEEEEGEVQELTPRSEVRREAGEAPESERVFADDFQARIAHQVLRGLVLQRELRGR